MAEDKLSIGLNILSFIIPLVGFILYFNYQKDAPKKAGGCKTWAWVGFGFSLFITIISQTIVG